MMKNLKIRSVRTHTILYNKGQKQRVILNIELSDSNYEYQIETEIEYEC